MQNTPLRNMPVPDPPVQKNTPMQKRRLVLAAVLLAAAAPATIAAGVCLLHNQHTMLVSLLVLLESMLPFFLIFEHREPRVREMVLIAMMAAITAAANVISAMTLPVYAGTAMVVVSGACLGPEAGFLVGALARLIANFFQAQGPWTPWQMFAWGVLGFLAGLLLRKRIPGRMAFAVYTFFSVFLIYGGIMNFGTLVMTSSISGESTAMTWNMLLVTYAAGIPYDLTHAAAAAACTFLFGRRIAERIERIRIKYGFYRTGR